MRGLGLMCLLFGAGAFVLPKMGYQFKVISIFGAYQMHAAIGFLAVGAVLTLLSFKGKKKDKK